MNISDCKFETAFMVTRHEAKTDEVFEMQKKSAFACSVSALGGKIPSEAMTVIKEDEDGILAKVSVYILTEAQMEDLLQRHREQILADYADG